MILLNRIKLSGYKSIREMDLELRSLNVLIGANGVGKSNFISFFKLLNHITSEGLRIYVGKSGGADALLHYGAKKTPQLECTVYFSSETGSNEYHIRLVSAAMDTLIFVDEQILYTKIGKQSKDRFSLGAGHRETKLMETLPDKFIEKSAKVIRGMMDLWRVYHFHDTSDTANIKTNSSINDNRYLRHDAGNLAAFLYWMKKKEEKYYKRIVATIQQIAPFFDDFILQFDKLENDSIILQWKEKGSDMIFSANQLSDGTLRMIALITLFLQPKIPSLIIIDEPELGLHPYAITVLASLLQGASAKSQIIVSTQSVSLVNALEPEDLIVVNRRSGQSEFKRHTSEELALWLEEYTLGELWEKNVIEGRPSAWSL